MGRVYIGRLERHQIIWMSISNRLNFQIYYHVPVDAASAITDDNSGNKFA